MSKRFQIHSFSRKVVIMVAMLLLVSAPSTVYAKAYIDLEPARLKAKEMLGAEKHTDDEILIIYKENLLNAFSQGKNFKPVHETRKVKKQDLESNLATLLADPTVYSVQPNYLYTTQAWTVGAERSIPNDYDLSKHWYYDKGNLPEMWKKMDCDAGATCGGDTSAVVAVIDTGLSVFTFDDTAGLTGANFLASSELTDINLYTNAGEIAANQLDDDCNGVVDDVNGFDAQAYLLVGSNTCTGGVPDPVAANYLKAGVPTDTYGHGNFVTGLIASNVDNTAGSVSPAFNVTVLPIAANIHFSNSFSTAGVIAAIDYAIAQGADVINMSLGGTGFDPAFDVAVQSAHAAGIVVIAAAGNSGIQQAVYPAAFDNVIGVGALTNNDERASYSTYGTHVDLSAYVGNGSLGDSAWQNTLTCMGSCNAGSVDNGFSERFGIGTSYAAPQVAAAAVLAKSLDATLDANDIEQILIESAHDRHVIGKDKQTGWGNIDFADIFDLVEFYNTPQPTSYPVYRFYNSDTGAHLYVNKESEKQKIIDTLPQFEFEGTTYRIFNQLETDTVAVHRFYNKDVKTHFYTRSVSEKDKIIAKFPQFLYEGERFFVYADRRVKTDPIYRFYNYDTGAHLYVRSETERYKVLAFYPQFYYEGVAYYVPDF
jgi:hypothetical protein